MHTCGAREGADQSINPVLDDLPVELLVDFGQLPGHTHTPVRPQHLRGKAGLTLTDLSVVQTCIYNSTPPCHTWTMSPSTERRPWGGA